MPRKGENIFKRKDGRWEARYIHHYERGKAKYRYVYGNSYTEVKQKRTVEMMTGEMVTTTSRKKSRTVEHISKEWLCGIKISVKESTYTRYNRIVMKYIIPHLGTNLISGTDSHLINMYAEHLLEMGGIRKDTLSPKTVTDILCVLKAIYKYGSLNGYDCPDLNGVRYPLKEKQSIRILTPESRSKFESVLLSSEDPTSLGILLSLFTGIRIGELCGLQWGDIDFIASTVRIRRTVQRIADLSPATESRTKVIVSKPKTEISVRTIPLPAFLKDHLFKCRKENSFFLLSGKPTYIEPHCFYLRYKKFLRIHGIGDYTFHALRHTFATQCIEYGFDTKSLSEILGHSNVTTTMMLYVHPSIEQKRKQMEMLTPKFN